MHRPISTSTTIVALALALTGCGAGPDATAGAPGPSSASVPPSSSAAAVSAEHDDDDVLFAQMMIPHHEQAVAMSEMLLAKEGVDPQVRERAQRVAEAQEPEIARMSSMLRAWGEPAGDGHAGGAHAGGADHGTEGMMSGEDMDRLMSAEGGDAAALFLEQMIEHHRGAVEMARQQIENGTNPEAVELAQAVVEDQEAEIREMESMQAELDRP